MAKRLLYRNIIFLNKKISNRYTLRGGLFKIFGLGKTRVFKLSRMVGLDGKVGMSSFERGELKKLESLVSNNYSCLEFSLKKLLTSHVKKKKNINSFKGFRHKFKLPVNGQRSRTNAKTQKSKKTIW
jgi:small subunit ribosomal protein S13